jgi:hypothetical protein
MHYCIYNAVMMNVIESINHIEELALSLGLSVKELYHEAGVDLSTRTRWRNKTTTPNFSTVAKLEKVISKKSRHKR